jgi:hypothetical protein
MLINIERSKFDMILVIRLEASYNNKTNIIRDPKVNKRWAKFIEPGAVITIESIQEQSRRVQ